MRLILSFTLLFAFTFANAQSFRAPAYRTNLENFRLNDSTVQKKWFVSSYSAVTASFIGFRGGSASIVSAPLGMQINRVLDKNFSAFAGVAIVPSMITFNHGFSSDATKGFSNSFMSMNPTRLAVNPAAYAGLSFTNDERTFQISGGISVQQRPLNMPLGMPHMNFQNGNLFVPNRF
ncbi:hypothetical protein [Aridibaculum aurantiacum]|uniref:hypothetical protein n=1 Tax=Aridibaculum aurantiacum TaxID=2810307 RepID=UPI001A95CFA3|nr:hypothetical protein [Aridibaculum aurantiacum]